MEMDDAFQSDDDEDVRVAESTPLTQQRTQESPLRLPRLGGDIQDTVDAGNRYDFENVYDHPPPGSPPPMSHMYVHPAIGNSNGFVPSPSTVQLPASNNQPSFLRRAVGVLLPTHYNRIPTSETNDSARGPTRGGGIENDGVFSNVLAKPTSQRSTRGENGDVHVMPEESQKDAPPVSILNIYTPSFAQLIKLLVLVDLVLCVGAGGCCTSLLGDDNCCASFWLRRHPDRWSSLWLCPLLRMELLDLGVVSIRRLYAHVLDAHNTRGKIWLKSWARSDTYTVRITLTSGR